MPYVSRIFNHTHTHTHTHTHIYIYIYIYMHASARDVMVPGEGIRYSELNSNFGRGCLGFTLKEKSMNSIILFSDMAKIVGETGLFNLGMATDQGEGKF